MESILSSFSVPHCCVQEKSGPQTSGGPEGIHLKVGEFSTGNPESPLPKIVFPKNHGISSH